jgi:hypothetical protein
MRAQPKLFNWQIGEPFFTPPGAGQLPTARQWTYLLVGGALLLAALRPYIRIAHVQGAMVAAEYLAVNLQQEYRDAYWSGRRHHPWELFE